MFVKYEIPAILRDKNWAMIKTPQNENQLKTHLFLRGTTHEDFTIEDLPELLELVNNYKKVDLNGQMIYQFMFKGEEFIILPG